MCQVYYVKLTAVQDTLCEESLPIGVISDKNPVVQPKNSYPICIYIFYRIFGHLAVQNL